jgi:hypothetical protein
MKQSSGFQSKYLIYVFIFCLTFAWLGIWRCVFMWRDNNHVNFDSNSQVDLQKRYSKTFQFGYTNVTKINSVKHIFLDWILPSNKMSLINYQQFEQLLSIFSNVDSNTLPSFRIFIIGPRSADYYKTGLRISKHQFQKYIKSGHNIKVIVIHKFPGYFIDDDNSHVNTNDKSNGNHNDGLNHGSLPLGLGRSYFTRTHTKCCGPQKGVNIRSGNTAPLSLSFFVRLYYLYHYGGIFTDFTIWFNQEIPSHITTGFNFKYDCMDDSDTKNEIKNECHFSSLLVFREPKHPVPLCILQHYENNDQFLECIDNDSNVGGNRSTIIECITKVFQHCFSMYNVKNDLDYTSNLESNWVSWIGADAIKGNWSKCIHCDSHSDPMSDHSSNSNSTFMIKRVRLNENTNIVLRKSHSKCINTNNIPKCKHYLVDSNSKSSISVLRQSNVSCSPNFALPGFMKAGTTFLYSTLSHHPHILNTLVGVSFKETGCYLPSEMSYKNANNRMNCFPFVQEDEQFLFGDGTTQYAGAHHVPMVMKKDNPNLRAIFSLREPIRRIESHHRYAYNSLSSTSFQNLNELIYFTLQSGSHLTHLRELAVDLLTCLQNSIMKELVRGNLCSKLSEKLIYYYHYGNLHASNIYKRTSYIIKNSIYIPALMHWSNIIGSSNIHIVVSERLRMNRTYNSKVFYQNELWQLYDFLGVCRINVAKKKVHSIHVTSRGIVPKDYELNTTSRNILQEYMKPFNLILSIMYNIYY